MPSSEAPEIQREVGEALLGAVAEGLALLRRVDAGEAEFVLALTTRPKNRLCVCVGIDSLPGVHRARSSRCARVPQRVGEATEWQ